MIALVLHFLFSTSIYAQVYMEGALGMSYSSSDKDSLSSMTGNLIHLGGGYRVGISSLEAGFSQTAQDNESLGDKKYDSQLSKSSFYLGGRLFLQNILSLRAGIEHSLLKSEIYRNNTREKSQEINSTVTNFYFGAGIFHELSQNSQVFAESILMPLADNDQYFLNILFGLRLNL